MLLDSLIAFSLSTSKYAFLYCFELLQLEDHAVVSEKAAEPVAV